MGFDMAKSTYLGKAMKPDDMMITVAVEDCKPQWDEIIRHTSEGYPAFSQEWKYYGKAWGWSIKARRKPCAT